MSTTGFADETTATTFCNVNETTSTTYQYSFGNAESDILPHWYPDSYSTEEEASTAAQSWWAEHQPEQPIPDPVPDPLFPSPWAMIGSPSTTSEFVQADCATSPIESDPVIADPSINVFPIQVPGVNGPVTKGYYYIITVNVTQETCKYVDPNEIA